MKETDVKSYTIVTGASEGIGRALSRALAEEGRNLILIARNRDRLDSLKTQLQSQYKIEIEVISQDLIAGDAVAEIVKQVDGRSVSCLINNAGFQVPIGPFQNVSFDKIRSMMTVNMAVLSELTYHFLPSVIKNRGEIINVASHAAFQPVPYMAAYAASKAYVLHFTEALQEELNDNHPGAVFVMALCPGATQTLFWERSASPIDKTHFSVMSAEDVASAAVRALRKRSPNVVIPSLLLRVATQALRLSSRRFNLIVGKRLVGH